MAASTKKKERSKGGKRVCKWQRGKKKRGIAAACVPKPERSSRKGRKGRRGLFDTSPVIMRRSLFHERSLQQIGQCMASEFMELKMVAEIDKQYVEQGAAAFAAFAGAPFRLRDAGGRDAPLLLPTLPLAHALPSLRPFLLFGGRSHGSHPPALAPRRGACALAGVDIRTCLPLLARNRDGGFGRHGDVGDAWHLEAVGVRPAHRLSRDGVDL